MCAVRGCPSCTGWTDGAVGEWGLVPLEPFPQFFLVVLIIDLLCTLVLSSSPSPCSWRTLILSSFFHSLCAGAGRVIGGDGPRHCTRPLGTDGREKERDGLSRQDDGRPCKGKGVTCNRSDDSHANVKCKGKDEGCRHFSFLLLSFALYSRSFPFLPFSSLYYSYSSLPPSHTLYISLPPSFPVSCRLLAPSPLPPRRHHP